MDKVIQSPFHLVRPKILISASYWFGAFSLISAWASVLKSTKKHLEINKNVPYQDFRCELMKRAPVNKVIDLSGDQIDDPSIGRKSFLSITFTLKGYRRHSTTSTCRLWSGTSVKQSTAKCRLARKTDIFSVEKVSRNISRNWPCLPLRAGLIFRRAVWRGWWWVDRMQECQLLRCPGGWSLRLSIFSFVVIILVGFGIFLRRCTYPSVFFIR